MKEKPGECSRQAVTSVDDEVRTGGVAGGVRGEVEVGALELLDAALTAHGDLVLPEVLDLLGHKVGDVRDDVAGGDGVGAGKLDPFHGEGFAWNKTSA